jgi:hypothetical protein
MTLNLAKAVVGYLKDRLEEKRGSLPCDKSRVDIRHISYQAP